MCRRVCAPQPSVNSKQPVKRCLPLGAYRVVSRKTKIVAKDPPKRALGAVLGTNCAPWAPNMCSKVAQSDPKKHPFSLDHDLARSMIQKGVPKCSKSNPRVRKQGQQVLPKSTQNKKTKTNDS